MVAVASVVRHIFREDFDRSAELVEKRCSVVYASLPFGKAPSNHLVMKFTRCSLLLCFCVVTRTPHATAAGRRRSAIFSLHPVSLIAF